MAVHLNLDAPDVSIDVTDTHGDLDDATILLSFDSKASTISIPLTFNQAKELMQKLGATVADAPSVRHRMKTRPAPTAVTYYGEKGEPLDAAPKHVPARPRM